MKRSSMFARSFGVLKFSYYLKHFCVAIVFTGIIVFFLYQTGYIYDVYTRYLYLPASILLANSLFYPYAHSLFDLALNRFSNRIVSTNSMLFFFGVAIIILCYMLSLILGPIGIITLYFLYGRKI